jgi:pyruvate,water dikinase
MKLSSIDNFPATEYGGKGASLMRLKSLGYNVPPFVVIPAAYFEQMKDNQGRLTADMIVACGGWPESMQEPINILSGTGRLAVRSSAVVEDGAAHSFAGLFRTELDVKPQDLPLAIARVWMSGYSKGVAAYKAAGGL